MLSVSDPSKVAARQLLGLDRKAPVIGLGALDAAADTRKGSALLAAALATNTLPQYQLLVFGARDDPLVARAAGNRVTFRGRIDDDERLAHVYAAADVFVAPSIQETFGKTLTEALACGASVVAFAGTGPDDIITYRVDGWLAACGDVEDLAQGIAWCLNHPEPHALRAAARDKVLREFAPAMLARSYIALYGQLMAEDGLLGRAGIPRSRRRSYPFRSAVGR